MRRYADLKARLERISGISEESAESIRAAWSTRAKPPGSLGRLESIVEWVGSVQKTDRPKASFAVLRLFAASHGITEEGVSMCPDHVNEQMFRNFCNGGAAINVLCRANRIDFQAIDVGITRPTGNFLKSSAMTEEEMLEALETGWNSVPERSELFAVGEMGIGNTTPAAAILATLLNEPVDKLTGRGAGLTDERLAHKVRVIEQALDVHRLDPGKPLQILAVLGGREIAAMTGAILRAVELNIPIVLDGVICAAAAAVAIALEPKTLTKCIAGHRGAEPAQRAFLRHNHLEAVVDFDMRLGEGTGAAVAMGVIRNAVDCFNEMATFEEAGVVL